MAGDGWVRYRHDFASLAAADPALIARVVRSGIEQADPSAARAVVFLAAAGTAPPDATSQLRGALAGAPGAFTVRAAQALYVLTEDRTYLATLTRMLQAPDEADRREAAAVLAELRLTT